MYCETIPPAIEVLINAGALSEEDWWDRYEAAPSGSSDLEVEAAVLASVLRELADDAERDAAGRPGSWVAYDGFDENGDGGDPDAFFSDGQPDEAQEWASYDGDC